LVLLLSNVGLANAKNVKYKSQGTVDFEELLIRGELKRPEISVVTGAEEDSLAALLRLRGDFTDRIAETQGELIE